MQGEASTFQDKPKLWFGFFLLYSTMDKYLFLKFKNVESKQIYLCLFNYFLLKKFLLFSVKTDF